MKTTGYYSIFFCCCCCCLCSVATSSGALTTSTQQAGPIKSFRQRLFPPKFASYEEAKVYFEARGKIQSLDINQAQKWFEKRGFGDDFETYFEAKDFFEKKGYLTKIGKHYDGSGQFTFARENEIVDKSAYHDTIVAIFLSTFVYRIAEFRKVTRQLAFKDEELKKEVLLGDSFANEDRKAPMVQLMQGNLKVSKDPNIKTPCVHIDQFEDVLRCEKFRSVSKEFTDELGIEAMHSFKVNKLYIHKFDAKYSKRNLVYCIAGRERQAGRKPGGKVDTDLFLSFRGSHTKRDWIQNLNFPLVEIHLRHDKQSGECYLVEQLTFQKIQIEKSLYDQLTEVVDRGSPIKVHRGILGYLFADRGNDGIVDADKDDDSMYTNIQLNIKRLIAQKSTETNALYVTGHSLGGGLATLASFFLACDKQLNSPANWQGVKCISFASPAVGNVGFQRAFEVLQSRQQYQSGTAKTKAIEGKPLFTNIRFTNNRDPVPFLVLFTRFRHMAGVNIHLNRPSLLSLWRPRKPYIVAERAHWKRTLEFRHPWKIFHPTSVIAGLFATTFRFIGFAATTVPSIFLLPCLFFRPISKILPTLEKFWYVFGKIGTLGLFQTTFAKTIAAFVQQPSFKNGLLGVLWASFFMLSRKKRATISERCVLLLLCLPVLTAATVAKCIGNVPGVVYLANYGGVYFVLGLFVAQVVMIVSRKPGDVLAFTTHGLNNYYEHLRPHHRLVSSSAVILKNYPLESSVQPALDGS